MDAFLTKLATREFIQGDTFILAFQFTDMDGGVIIPTLDQISWNLCTYDDYQTTILSLNGRSNPSQFSIDGNTGIIYVVLTTSNTQNLLDGKYIQQPVLTFSGNQYIRAWGEVIFRRKVGGV